MAEITVEVPIAEQVRYMVELIKREYLTAEQFVAIRDAVMGSKL